MCPYRGLATLIAAIAPPAAFSGSSCPDRLPPTPLYTRPSREDDFLDVGWEQDAQSSPSATSPQLPQQPKDYRPSALGFEPPPDGPMPGIRARKSRGRKVGMQPLGADG